MRLLLQLIHPVAGGAEAFILDEGLVHDAAEAGAGGVIPSVWTASMMLPTLMGLLVLDNASLIMSARLLAFFAHRRRAKGSAAARPRPPSEPSIRDSF